MDEEYYYGKMEAAHTNLGLMHKQDKEYLIKLNYVYYINYINYIIDILFF